MRKKGFIALPPHYSHCSRKFGLKKVSESLLPHSYCSLPVSAGNLIIGAYLQRNQNLTQRMSEHCLILGDIVCNVV